jgi:hypothetical protein
MLEGARLSRFGREETRTIVVVDVEIVRVELSAVIVERSVIIEVINDVEVAVLLGVRPLSFFFCDAYTVAGVTVTPAVACMNTEQSLLAYRGRLVCTRLVW